MNRLPSALRSLPLLVGLLLLSPALSAAPDIRILVDVSGSMKTTDPQNLRMPALRMLAQLLPAGATAGVWLFDQGVAPLVPVGPVNDKWKTLTRNSAAKIHSRGLFTNIESALSAASRDWGANDAADRHIVLLTDGKVDVAKDEAASAASRERVLGPQLAELKMKGAKIHAIALSADADTELLQTLASGTGGWREQAPSADTLQRAFLHIFEQATSPNTLPLAGNRFTVDSSVSEVTLLVFRKAEAPPIALTGPDGKTYTVANTGDNIRWQTDAGYDLVTLRTPQPGAWSFSGKEDPDNRALVVTDLALRLGELPTHLMHGQTLSLEASLVEHGAPIARNDFLRIVSTAAGLTGPGGAGDVLDMPLNENTHAFTANATPQLAPGIYELTIRARSGTFEREKRHRLEIHDQALSFEAQASGQGQLQIDWQAQPDLINPSSISGYVLVEGPDKFRDVQEINPEAQGPASMTFDVRYGGQYEVTAQTLMRDKAGQTLQLRLAPQTVEVKAPPPPPAGPSLEVPLASAPSPAINAWRTLAIVLGGNFALALVLVPVWYKLRRRAIPSKGVSL